MAIFDGGSRQVVVVGRYQEGEEEVGPVELDGELLLQHLKHRKRIGKIGVHAVLRCELGQILHERLDERHLVV
jgi:hypothetical protein